MIYDMPFNEDCPRSWRATDFTVSNDVCVMEIGYNRMPAGFKQIIKRDVFILHYIIEGNGKFMGQSFTPNHAYLVHPGELEIFEAEENSSYETYWIIFGGSGCKKLLKEMGLPPHNGVFEFENNSQCAEVLHHALFDSFPENELEEFLLMQSALYKILSVHAVGSRKMKHITPAERAKGFIDRNWQKELNFDALAHKMNYSRSQLYKLFKKTYGISMKEYLVDLRIEKSKELLSDKTVKPSISETAYAVGYKNPLYFSRLFHKKTGLSPSEYRRL